MVTKVVHASDVPTLTREEIKGTRTVIDDKGREVRRDVVYTLEDNMAGMGDYFHPERGWLRPHGIPESDPPNRMTGEQPTSTDYEPGAIEQARLEEETLEQRQRAAVIAKLLEGENY